MRSRSRSPIPRHHYHHPPPPPPPPPAGPSSSSLPPFADGGNHMGYEQRGRGRSRSRSPPPFNYREGDNYYGNRSPAPYRSSYHHRSRSPPPRYSSHPPRYGSHRGGFAPPPPHHHPRRQPAIVERGSDEERSRSTCIFVGNLPYSYVNRDVTRLFERFGRIKTVSMPIDRYTNRHKGFAFVEFEQRLDAEDAFFKYDGYMLEGRKLRCDWDIGVDHKEHLKPTGPSSYDRRRERSPARVERPAYEDDARRLSPVYQDR